MNREIRARWSLLGLGAALCIALVMSIGTGPMAIGMSQSLHALLAGFGVMAGETIPAHIAAIVEAIRLPRALLAMLVGAALAVSGAALQGLFRNPLADPGLIGVSGGASLAAVAVIVLGDTVLIGLSDLLGAYTLPLAAFAGALCTTLIVARIATSRFGTSMTALLLAGLAIGIVTGAGTGLLTFMANDDQLRALTFWSMGSLGGATWDRVIAAGALILLALSLMPFVIKALNALLLGESEARHLGIDVERAKRWVITLSALAVGASVAVSGMIGFVGLIVPHIVRLSLGPDHRYLLPASALLGALFLLVADMFSRTVIAPAELPIGLLTTLIGGPVFIGLIVMRAKRSAL